MKKNKFLMLTVFVLLFSILLTSCSDKKAVGIIDTVFNEDYEVEYRDYSSTDQIKALDGYSFYKQQDEIVVFSNGIDTEASYIFYNLATRKIILTLSDYDSSYEVVGINSKVIRLRTVSPYVDPWVTDKDTATTSTNTQKSLTKQQKIVEYVAYDYAGNLLAKSSTKDSFYASMYGDLVLFNKCVYKTTPSGKLEKLSGFDSYSLPNYSFNNYNDKYYYHYPSTSVNIFDKSFNHLCTYRPPSYVKNLEYYILNNGNMLVQGNYLVDEASEEYDYFVVSDEGKTLKYNLYHMLIDPENNKETPIKLDCYLEEVKSAYSYNAESNGKKIYSDSFENIAVIKPITDKRIDDSDGAKDIILMDNNAKPLSSLKLLKEQAAEIPQKISENRYIVKMLDGSHCLVDKNGAVVERLYNYLDCYGSYIRTDDAVYDLDMNLVFHEKDGDGNQILGASEDTIYICEITDGTKVYYSLRNGTKKEIYRIAEGNTSNSITATDFGYKLKTDDKYVWYNNSGEELITTDFDSYTAYSYQDSKIYSVTEQRGSGKLTTYFCIYK